MEKDKMILKDGTAIELEAAASLGSMQAVFPDMEAVGAFWDKCTDENLSEIKITNGEGLTVGTYHDMRLQAPALILEKTVGGIQATFGLRQMTDYEKLAVQVQANTEAVSVHEDAIGDMGAVLSAVAEAQEGAEG